MSGDESIIELEGGDGSKFRCQVLDIVTFKEKEYGVLLELESDSLVIMELVPKDEGHVFRTIADDAEFEEVMAFVKELADQSGQANDD